MAQELERLLTHMVTGTGRNRRGGYITLGVVLVAGILALDTLTPYELNFAFLYPLPILLLTIAAGKNAGYLLSLLCSVFIVVSDMYGGKVYSHVGYMIFDAAAYACIYLAFTLLAGTLCSALRREVLFSRADELTGLANRKRLEEFAGEELERCRRYVAPFTLVLVDCRDFRQVNDAFGRPAGDRILSVVARTLRDTVRGTDLASRLEGDKFALVLQEASPEAARAAVQNIEAALLAATHAMKLDLGFCLGAVCCTNLAAEFEQVLAEAGTAMRRAYAAGGGVCFVHSEC
jgi:diguanylate cyclase (GGDEF) domain